MEVSQRALSRACVGRLLFAVTFLLLSRRCSCAETGGDINIRVLSCTWNTHVPKSFTTAVNAGFSASMASRNWTVAGKVRVEMVYARDEHAVPEDFINDELSKIPDNDNNITIVLGPVGDDTVLGSIPALRRHQVVAFAPMTGSGEVRGWNPELYFLRADPTMETLVLIRYAVGHIAVKRLGFMYLKGNHYGDKEYDVALQVMEGLGSKLHGVFAAEAGGQGSVPDKVYKAEFERFASAKPQAVLLFGAPRSDTGRFLISLLSDRRTVKTFVLAPSGVQVFLELMWHRALNAAKLSFLPGQLLIAGTNPLARDSRYVAVNNFQGIMRDYLKTHANETGISDPDYFLKHDTDGELMVYGWMAGEVLAQALSVPEWLTSRKTFMDSLYNQRRFVINDFVIGNFGGPCEGAASEQGASCECNQGGNVVYVREVRENFTVEMLENGLVELSAMQCFVDSPQLHPPLNGIVFFLDDNPEAADAAGQWLIGARPRRGDGSLGYSDQFFLHALTATTAGSAKMLGKACKTRVVTAVFGVVTNTIKDKHSVPLIDPIELEPRLNVFQRDVIRLSPTVEQQIVVLARYLSSFGGQNASAVVGGSEARNVLKVIKKSLEHQGGALNFSATRRSEAPLDGMLPTSGAVYVLGLSLDDVKVVEKHLVRHPGVRVLVLFSDAAMFYKEFVMVFNSSAAAPRLLFATSLPHWGHNETSSPLVRSFHARIKDHEKWTPLALLGFATGRLMEVVLLRAEQIDDEALVNFFYSESSVNLEDMRYGVFSDSECDEGVTTQVEMCRTNYGATRIAVWSMARVLNASIPPLADPMTPSLEFLVGRTGLSKEQVIAVAIGSVVAGLLLVVLGIVLYVCLHHTRDNVSAPRDPTEPVTLIFTDIENSTAQWAAHPDVMADAVATHHRLIRALISYYECYEVKTVGDSFMIACRGSIAAVKLARDLQRNFLHARWGTTRIDDFYCAEEVVEGERAAAASDGKGRGGGAAATAELDPEVYRKLWNGLRVRVGVHTGRCDIRYDEVTKGYDYYGQTSNTAARTESVANGGQVLLTGAAYFALSTEERRPLDVTHLGAVPLRGVPDPVEMYQLNAVPGRTFAPLRLEQELELPENSSGGSHMSFNDALSAASQLGEGGERVYSVLRALFRTFTTSQRQHELKPLCERWRVPLPSRRGSGAAAWNDDYCDEALQRLAVKVGHIVDVAIHAQGPDISVADSSDGSNHNNNGSGSYCSSFTPTILISNPTIDEPAESWGSYFTYSEQTTDAGIGDALGGV